MGKETAPAVFSTVDYRARVMHTSSFFVPISSDNCEITHNKHYFLDRPSLLNLYNLLSCPVRPADCHTKPPVNPAQCQDVTSHPIPSPVALPVWLQWSDEPVQMSLQLWEFANTPVPLRVSLSLPSEGGDQAGKGLIFPFNA